LEADMTIGEKMKTCEERIQEERDECYSRPEVKHQLLMHFHGPDYLNDWPPINTYAH
jgi:hypothetical protein